MQNIYLTPHFSLKEMCESRTAENRGIMNEPSEQEIENLRRLCENTLEPLHEALKLPVVITSGFRTKALNSIIAHTAERSQHMQGCAADFYAGHTDGTDDTESSRERLIRAFRLILLDPKIEYDQLILYPNFIHVSHVSREANRHGILIGRRDGKLGYGRITLSNALKIF